jgi:hypothetical protein
MDPHLLAPWIRIRNEVKSWIRIRISIETYAEPQHCGKYNLQLFISSEDILKNNL